MSKRGDTYLVNETGKGSKMLEVRSQHADFRVHNVSRLLRLSYSGMVGR